MFTLGIGDASAPIDNNWTSQPAPTKASDYRFRIILSGESGVGKTSLAHRIVKNEFNPRLSMYNVGDEFFDIAYAHLTNREGDLAKLVLIDIHGDNYKRINSIIDDAQYQATVAFIICNMGETKQAEEFGDEIDAQTISIMTKYPACKFVLVCTKQDMLENKRPFLLKYVADRCDLMGVAIVSAKTGIYVKELITVTLEHLVADIKNTANKASKAGRAHFFKDPETLSPVMSSSMLPCQSLTKSNSSSSSSSGKLEGIDLNEEKKFIPHIEARIAELEREILSIFAANKERKLQKIYALKEVLVLNRLFPNTSLIDHVADIREKYEAKGLDDGSHSRTKALLDDIVSYNKFRPIYRI